MIEKLESDLGVPVVHALPAQYWDIQRHLRVRIPEAGLRPARGGNAMMVRLFLALVRRCCVLSGVRAADFYQGKQVTIVVGFSSAGTYDATARLFARHLGKYLPGKPTVIVRNMPGAGSLVATNSLYSSLPKDGTTLGVIGGGVVLEPLLGNPQATYDPRRFNWIGGRTRDNFLCLVWHTVAGANAARRHQARNRRRRDRPGFAHADLSEGAQRAAGHEIQDRVGLSRRQRDHARPGAG